MSVGAEDRVTGGEVTLRRRRRSWSEAEKRRIVAQSLEPGASVSLVARRHDVNANQVFTWRRQLRDRAPGGGAAACGFVPVVMAPPGCGASVSGEPTKEVSDGLAAPSPPPTGRIEIELAGGRRVIVDRAVDAAALACVIAVLERR